MGTLGFSLETLALASGIMAALCLILLVVLHLRYKPFNPTAIVTVLEGLIHEQERLEGVMHEESARGRTEHAQAAQALRGELLAMVHALGDTVSGRVSIMAAQQKDNLEGFGRTIERLSQSTEDNLTRIRDAVSQTIDAFRQETRDGLKSFGDSVLARTAEHGTAQKQHLDAFAGRMETLSQTIDTQLAKNRESSESSAKALREESAKRMSEFQTFLHQRLETMLERLDGIRDAMEKRLHEIQQAEVEASRVSREETAIVLKRFGESLETRLANLTQSNENKLGELRTSVETKLSQIQTDNAAKLEEMRRTVDEKLQGTLEKRLGQSFQLVSERLELVHKGLGEMQTLAAGVGDLKKVLTNVKTRGTWGEVQLERLLEQIFAPGQFVKNFSPNGRESVEFAVRMAGREGEMECMLPIDAKYPVEDYERLLAAVEAGSPEAADVASKQIEIRIKACAKDIREKYICPPTTTIFAVLFLPVEGLYAEVLRRPGLVESLQRDFRVVIAGPTTLTAILSSVQMGLAVAAISKRSEEVWKTLGAVKLEFRKYGDVLDKVKKSLTSATNQLDTVSTRSRAIERKLRSVTELPEAESRQMLTDIEDIMGDMAAEGQA
ncbi:DNA recombination protein RmuC [Desulfolutivibrio sulfoxidireducens]|uniref:DNA recombination protein RmuC n=1 Tax=Desulfolutivibrio sulfoxidireducens TaxID=2773299 RepID=UPI001C401046|nr:DNA recombination protein RmuC [Desulfolutivibrio sulfoxidireducens]